MSFNAVKVFSATVREARETLGEQVSNWVRESTERGCRIADVVVTQSSDSQYHCLAITVFYVEPPARGRRLNFSTVRSGAPARHRD